MPSLTALFVGLGSIGTRHLNNLAALCAQRGLTLRADAPQLHERKIRL